MTRLNIFLTLIAIVCALGAVTSQHEARKLFMELEKEQKEAINLAVEWDQLLLEQSTVAMRTQIEKIATEKLLMKVPDESQIKIISLIESDSAEVSVDKEEL
ncbi:MAG: cell division protein FtsL [Nitrosomonadaceae bacterium]|nr:cell division protein FtsL [Nitrosomonadaceae bacterium]